MNIEISDKDRGEMCDLAQRAQATAMRADDAAKIAIDRASEAKDASDALAAFMIELVKRAKS